MIIGFSTTNKPLSRLIRRFTHSKASHAYTIFTVAGEPLVIHSTRNGVNCDYYHKFVKHNTIVAEYKLLVDTEAEQLALSEAIKLLDQPYDFLSIVGFALVLACKAVGLKIKAPFRNKSAYHCSELALTILRTLVLDCPGMKRELTSPEDLMHCLNEHKQAERL